MIDPATLAAWLPQTRWFAAKGAGVPAVVIHDAAALPDAPVTIAIAEVSPGSETDRYLVPLANGTDAAADPAFAGWLVRTVLGNASLAGLRGSFVGHAGDAASPTFEADTTATVAALGGDASNTSLMVTMAGRRFAVKLLRRCRAGIQPEVEVGAFLAEGDWAGTPRLRGWLEYVPAEGPTVALATVHDFAADCANAWDRLVTLCSTGGLAGPAREHILGIVSLLGGTTADMHRALGSRTDVPGFAPTRPTLEEHRAESVRMVRHASRVLDQAADRLAGLPSIVAGRLAALAARRAAIIAALGRLDSIDSSASLIRVHGDYHLGQVLLHDPGPVALVIDFEGEPGRSLEERRRPASVCKDLAGMCRSFDYLLRHVARCGGPAYRVEHLRLLEDRFLEAYRRVSEGQAWWPRDPAVAAELLGVYKLDKAVYELAYEIANRPEWIEVPLAALVS